MNTRVLVSGFVLAFVGTVFLRAETPGRRPYEMDWANRQEDVRKPLVDFEDLQGWTVTCQDAVGVFSQSREQQVWGDFVAKLVYRADGTRPEITIAPPKPLPIEKPFDCVNLWVYGNNWAWAPDRSTPPVEIRVLLQSDSGTTVPIVLGSVRWKEWWLMHRRLSAEQLAQLGEKPRWIGIQVRNGRNKDDRSIFFDNLAIYAEPLPALKFEPRPKRNLQLPDGQSVGNNTGPGTLPFPTREETILPGDSTNQFTVTLDKSDDVYTFQYTGDDGQLIYHYRPITGTLSDVQAEWIGCGSVLRPLDGGGVVMGAADAPETAARQSLELIRCQQRGDTVCSNWRCTQGDQSTEIQYTLRLWQKSLVVDIECSEPVVGEFCLGKVVGAENPRIVTVPYLVGAEQRPGILVSGAPEHPLFVSALLDHYRTNSSLFWFANRVSTEGATINGGSRYLPKTDGTRNRCFERLFLTVTPRFEETLPNIPNPQSPWMHIAGDRVWRAHGASDRQRDYEHWKKVARYGMTQVVITDHETGWRDGGESFTMRTRAAPGKGGDAGQAEYARKIRALGFRYGIYNNYTDYAPVNEHWDEDYVTRTPENQWRTAWARCYNPKPARAVEVESRLAPVIQEKFQLDTAYCDVHTAVRPWSYCDFDARVPGAGMFAATFYAYGEIMLHQKATWNGPVYSEGNNHWYYCGLTDGNYGQDQLGHLATDPWLVDFDLLKMHPLGCSFGMGNPGMFFGRKQRLGATEAERQSRLDRFLAATLAFGHTGFLVFEGGFENAVQSYYCLQQVHANYARQTVESIRYADQHGNLLDTSHAVASGVYRRSQIVTRYDNGLEVYVNGHTAESWQTPHALLPPNGWYVHNVNERSVRRAADKSLSPHTLPSAPLSRCAGGGEGPFESGARLTALSAMIDGHRADYVDSPAYVYANGRGMLTRFSKATCDGQLIAICQPGGTVEVIPLENCRVIGVDLDGRAASGMALDVSRQPIGPAVTRYSRGLVYITAVPNATSYMLTPTAPPMKPLGCQRVAVVPGETVEIEGVRPSAFRIEADAKVGTQLWHRVDDQWIDFTVAPLVHAALRIADDRYELTLAPRTQLSLDATVQLGPNTRDMQLRPGQRVQLEFPRVRPKDESVLELPLTVTVGELRFHKMWWIKSEYDQVKLAEFSEHSDSGQRLRGEAERPLDPATKAGVTWTERSCGEEARRCLFMHPPYSGGVGYSFALLKPMQLPARSSAAFRCEVGKADGSDPGDGILFRVAVIDSEGNETPVAERQWIQHAWTPLEADLSRWKGERVIIKLITDVGPADNSSGDWGCWSGLCIESLTRELVTEAHDLEVTLTRDPAPLPVGNLTLKDVRSATSAILHFQGVGVQQGAPYVSFARLNNIELGELPGAGGNEREGIWADAKIQLPPAAIASLQQWNVVTLQNPGHDSFKVGRFWIELTLSDGRRASSQITRTVFTQPTGWLHAEGTGVPFDEDIAIHVRLPMEAPL